MKTRIPPPVFLVIAAAAMWFVAHSPFAVTLHIPFALALAAIPAILGVGISARAMRQFRSAQTTVNPLKPEQASALVRTGIYRRTRNPMYLGLLLILIGWALWLGSISNIIVLLLFVIAITELQIKPEEAALRTLFGKEYEDYCREVRRWI